MSPVRNSPQALRIVRRVFLVLGICLATFGVWSGVQARDFLHRSIPTTGRVVEVSPVHGGGGNGATGTVESYAPTFQFSDSTGASFTVTSTTSSNPPEFRVGEIVPVRYDPKRPTEAQIDSFLQLWLFSGVFGFVGLSFAVIGAVLFVVERRRRQSALTQ